MGVLRKLLDPLGELIKTGSDKELKDTYEKLRQEWLKKGGGEKTPDMKRLDNELERRAEEKWKNDPRRSKDPNYRWSDSNRWEKD